jgi:hypothetical protein
MNPRPPVHPYLVLLLAILMPGGGHVLAGQPQRGFGFAVFTLILAAISWHTTTPEHSIIGRAALGLFVWAISIPDAYRVARTNTELWQRGRGGARS